MKAVLISIRPKWCRLISCGRKTVEVRKTRPKIDTPFRCYIYETQGATDTPWMDEDGHMIFRGRGQVIGKFVCDRIDHFDSDFDEWARSCAPPGSIIDSMGWEKFNDIIANEALLTDDEINDYFPENIDAWLWHISDLVIYDTPRELAGLRKPDGAADPFFKRPPQSWCYVEEP